MRRQSLEILGIIASHVPSVSTLYHGLPNDLSVFFLGLLSLHACLSSPCDWLYQLLCSTELCNFVFLQQYQPVLAKQWNTDWPQNPLKFPTVVVSPLYRRWGRTFFDTGWGNHHLISTVFWHPLHLLLLSFTGLWSSNMYHWLYTVWQEPVRKCTSM